MPASRHQSILLGLLASLAAACSGADDPSIETPDHPAEESVQGELPTLFEAREPALGEADRDNLRRRDAGADGWRSEVQHDLAKAALGELLHDLIDPGHGPRLEELLAEDFRGSTRLRPDELELRSEVPGFQVRRTARPDAELQPPGRLRQLAEDLMEPLGGGEGLRAAKKIVSVDAEDRRRFATTALIQLFGLPEGAPIQVSMEWRAHWIVEGEGEEERALLLELHLSDYEEVRAHEELFADLTGHAFGGLPGYREEIQQGVDDYHMRMDRLAGQSFLGMQGLALGDVNGDGRDDLYVCQQGGLPNLLLIRQAGGTVEDRAARAGVDFLDGTRSALLLDLDGDGDQDLALAVGPDVLVCLNDGQGRYPDGSEHRVRLEGTGSEDVYSLSVADPDRDGDLDLYACRYVSGGVMGGVPTPYYDARNGASNLYWRCEGALEYTLANEQVGLEADNSRFSLSSIWEDFDGDGQLDLYVTNDFGRNCLYRNEGGRFRNVAGPSGAEDMASGMGVSCADVEGDGDVDLYVTNMFSSAGLRIASQQDRFGGGRHQELHRRYLHHARGNTLLLNQGDGTFADATMEAGVSLGRWAWGSIFTDLNNDGLDDLFIPNGFITSRSDPDDL